jgi:hypothetical protein
VPFGSIEAAYGRPLGSFRNARVLTRNGLGEWGGRVLTMQLEFSTGAITVTGDDFRARLGLKSNWFTFAPPCPVPTWSDWRSIGGALASGTSAISRHFASIDVFALGGAAGDTLYRRVWDRQWGNWTNLGRPAAVGLRDTPGAVTWTNGTSLDVFAAGTDNRLWWRSWRLSGGWTGWRSLGGSVQEGVASVALSPASIQVFAIGGATGDHLLQRGWNGQWSPWIDLGRPADVGLTMTPGAVVWDGGRLDVFARGADGSLRQRAWIPGTGWTGWFDRGGVLASGPSAVSPHPGRIDVFAIGGPASDALQARAWEGTWQDWTDLGQPPGLALDAHPGAVAWLGGRVDVFPRGADTTARWRFHPCL